ncbi:unnamed protein product [Rhizoctonia solani]|nr:unnamed protein product [Rhizoctonia solani]
MMHNSPNPTPRPYQGKPQAFGFAEFEESDAVVRALQLLDVKTCEEQRDQNPRERRYEPRERQRMAAIERAMQRERGLAQAEEKDRHELGQRLAEWDDDASDEPFYIDRARWRQARQRFLASETQANDASRALEERQAEHLRLESEAFLARQMDEMRALAEEQRKAGLLLDDGAPVRLAISAVEKKEKEEEEEKKVVAKPVAVFGQEKEEETAGRRRRENLVKLDFEAAERERLVVRLHRDVVFVSLSAASSLLFFFLRQSLYSLWRELQTQILKTCSEI